MLPLTGCEASGVVLNLLDVFVLCRIQIIIPGLPHHCDIRKMHVEHRVQGRDVAGM